LCERRHVSECNPRPCGCEDIGGGGSRVCDGRRSKTGRTGSAEKRPDNVAVRKKDIDVYEAIIRENEKEPWRANADARALFRFLNVCPPLSPGSALFKMPEELNGIAPSNLPEELW
jgi:hypothetical protein